ncbi:MAG: sugar ABC transporter permease [Candidatus Bipolaricaulota bacterium]|nr:sugar ABC transporter permease [Candidatus Bipolaricaulota bacterium]MBS3792634.1 sugar ABC transporter permease [Candidatus Bipolaricaulota bacterium]
MSKEYRGLIYLAPVMLLIGLFFIYPAISIIRMSFFETRYGIEFTFAGLGNYFQIFRDGVVGQSAINSLIWTGLGLFLQLSIPLGTAILLDQKFYGNTFARSAMLIPWITPSVIVAILGRWMLEPSLGIFNEVLVNLGLISESINFLGNSSIALPTLIGMQTWQFIPFGTLLILSALQTIPRNLYDSMKVDGAGSFQLFRYLIFPRIGPMIGFMGFLAFVWNFNVFDKIWLTTQGGPGNATTTLPLLVYKRAFKTFRLGQSSALASIMVVALVAFGVFYFKFLWQPVERD